MVKFYGRGLRLGLEVHSGRKAFRDNFKRGDVIDVDDGFLAPGRAN
jgi:hypothetical protein